MVKIKRKVEMTIEEYAKHMIDKYGIRCFENKLIDDNIIDAPMKFKQEFELNPVSKSDLLNGSFRNGKTTVEVEEEITEDTELDLIERFIGGMGSVCYTSHTMSINKCLRMAPDYINTTHFYIENDDRELVLIWRDGKLVE
ncbi:hypothetical protein [Staphylococcus pseudoxylosus]|uniref:Phage PVL protein n=1 Tax=Staphylococcus pseudoxylosus TaxID=2282419 RepID=A0AAQ0MMK3_9STAP|nr:hypothetical protein [Staphylococcus pseudoxylosus]MCE5003380.1 hypothetical protein [Staphylococcus pseudoxylosus]RMI86497.1 hypothetical protein D9V42_01500 [Staphylococcus pseudoxylosus]